MPDPQPHRFDSFFQLGPLTIAIIYLLLGLSWIWFSDDLVMHLAGGNQAEFHILSSFKGSAYIVVTAILLYFTILYFIRKTAEGQEALRKSERQTRILNRKLGLMNDVTYQDIQNKITAARGFVDLATTGGSNAENREYLDRTSEILETIQALIAKTKEYQRMGTDDLRWIAIGPAILTQFSLLKKPASVTLVCDMNGVEIFADPQIERVFSILSLNALTHGGNVTRIAFTYRESPGGLVIACEDDGMGIPSDQKSLIFNRVVGGTGNFHLFFIREFLTLYGMTIAETGSPGGGARFEITVPEGAYRIRK